MENETMSLGLRKRIARTVPFGYKVSEQDDKLLEPIPQELEAIEQAKQYLKSCSYREVAGWIERKTGRYISAPGLRKVLSRNE
jgi:hypothetical protein|tara:strand:- start:485 stop:733 length:249 start_codon:yes stop_codon:yes gene_type:complete